MEVKPKNGTPVQKSINQFNIPVTNWSSHTIWKFVHMYHL